MSPGLSLWTEAGGEGEGESRLQGKGETGFRRHWDLSSSWGEELVKLETNQIVDLCGKY